MNEVWELVDINENKTGVMIERGTNTPIPQGMYHTAVDVWTKSKDGKILLTQRHPNKAWGLKWECSGGAMVAGESPIDSARRELEEETGVQVTKEKLTYLGKTIMNEYQCIMYTYLVVLTEDVEVEVEGASASAAVKCLVNAGLFEDYAEYQKICEEEGMNHEKVSAGTFTFKKGTTKVQIAKKINWG